jgi:teichuronic acid exporter
MNMKNNTIRTSLIYKYLERCGYQGIAFVVQIILARLLEPSDYGILALLTIFIAISQVFVQSGLNTALIQRKDVDDADYSSVFWVSAGIAVILYGVLFLAAPAIAAFYKMPQLSQVLRVLALILIPGAFNSIQNAKIARDMQFKKLMYSSLGAVVVSGATGVILACAGFGVWALVGQQLANQMAICIIMRFAVKWRLKLIIKWNRVKVLFSFGWKLLCSSLLETVYQNLRSLVIGKKYDSGTLALYNRGQQFPQLVVDNINGSIQSVMLPALSEEQDNTSRMKAMMRRSVITSSFIIFPMMAGLAAVAEPLVKLLLTDKWLPCVPYLQAYCFIFAFYPIHTANLQALNAQGRSDKFLQLEIIKKILGIGVLGITVFCFDSPLAIAYGGAATTLIGCFINAWPNKKLLNYSYFEQMKDILPSMMLSLVMGAAIYAVLLFNLSSYLTLMIQAIAGTAIYIALAFLFKLECFIYLKNMMIGCLEKCKQSSGEML